MAINLKYTFIWKCLTNTCQKLTTNAPKKSTFKTHSGLAGVAQWIELQACEPKGHCFDSHSGHMPGLQVRSPVGGAQEATTH